MSEAQNVDKKLASGWKTLAELKEQCKDQEEFLIEGILPKVGIAGLVGPSDCGKSTLSRQLSLSIAARATSFIGFPLNVEHGKVCYVSTEDSESSTMRIASLQCTGLGYDDDTVGGVMFLHESDNTIRRLEAFLGVHKVDLIVVDGWADVFQGNTNDLSQVRSNLNEFDRLAKKYMCCILLLHHARKKTGQLEPHKDLVNGSQAFEAKCRLLMHLCPKPDDDDLVYLTMIKGNHLLREEKGVKYVLKMESTRILIDTGKTEGKKSGPVEKAKFSKELWFPRIEAAVKQFNSVNEAMKQLPKLYPNEVVPKRTWYNENRDKLSDGAKP